MTVGLSVFERPLYRMLVKAYTSVGYFDLFDNSSGNVLYNKSSTNRS